MGRLAERAMERKELKVASDFIQTKTFQHEVSTDVFERNIKLCKNFTET